MPANAPKIHLVAHYQTLYYGGTHGYQQHRAQMTLLDASKKVIAYLAFADENRVCEPDRQDGEVIRMHLPIHLLPSIHALLSSGEPVRLYFAQGRGFLGHAEPVSAKT